MAEALYHRDIYMPKNNAPTGLVRVSWSRHAKDAARDDRYGHIPTSRTLDLTNATLVELAQEDGVDTKYVMRTALDDVDDVVYVLRYYVSDRGIRNYKVVTVWINRASDTHRTLGRSKYAVSS